jgi:hypothetical protein
MFSGMNYIWNSHCYRLHPALPQWEMSSLQKDRAQCAGRCVRTCNTVQILEKRQNSRYGCTVRKGKGPWNLVSIQIFTIPYPTKTTFFSFTRSLLGSILTSWTVDWIYCSYRQLHNSGLSLQRLHSKKHTGCVHGYCSCRLVQSHFPNLLHSLVPPSLLPVHAKPTPYHFSYKFS